MTVKDVTGINFHWGGYYTYFTRNQTTGDVSVSPLFYGFWFFAQAIQGNAIMLNPINTTHTNILFYPSFFFFLLSL